MSLVHNFHTLAFLLEIPASYRLVIRYRQQIAASWMENQSSNPIVMPNQGLVACTPVVPYFDEFISATCRQKFPAAACCRWLFVPGNTG
jgi:hypothetical protein